MVEILIKAAGIQTRTQAPPDALPRREAQVAQKQDKQTQRLMEAIEDNLRHHVLGFGGQRKY